MWKRLSIQFWFELEPEFKVWWHERAKPKLRMTSSRVCRWQHFRTHNTSNTRTHSSHPSQHATSHTHSQNHLSSSLFCTVLTHTHTHTHTRAQIRRPLRTITFFLLLTQTHSLLQTLSFYTHTHTRTHSLLLHVQTKTHCFGQNPLPEWVCSIAIVVLHMLGLLDEKWPIQGRPFSVAVSFFLTNEGETSSLLKAPRLTITA